MWRGICGAVLMVIGSLAMLLGFQTIGDWVSWSDTARLCQVHPGVKGCDPSYLGLDFRFGAARDQSLYYFLIIPALTINFAFGLALLVAQLSPRRWTRRGRALQLLLGGALMAIALSFILEWNWLALLGLESALDPPPILVLFLGLLVILPALDIFVGMALLLGVWAAPPAEPGVTSTSKGSS